MRGCLLVMLACGFFIAALAFALVILFSYGGLAFLFLYRYGIMCLWRGSKSYFGKEG